MSRWIITGLNPLTGEREPITKELPFGTALDVAFKEIDKGEPLYKDIRAEKAGRFKTTLTFKRKKHGK